MSLADEFDVDELTQFFAILGYYNTWADVDQDYCKYFLSDLSSESKLREFVLPVLEQPSEDGVTVVEELRLATEKFSDAYAAATVLDKWKARLRGEFDPDDIDPAEADEVVTELGKKPKPTADDWANLKFYVGYFPATSLLRTVLPTMIDGPTHDSMAVLRALLPYANAKRNRAAIDVLTRWIDNGGVVPVHSETSSAANASERTGGEAAGTAGQSSDSGMYFTIDQAPDEWLVYLKRELDKHIP